jgi:hypothetical protein
VKRRDKARCEGMWSTGIDQFETHVERNTLNEDYERLVWVKQEMCLEIL